MLQMSDWEKRPLSSKQMEYAALDAFVLLQIYDIVSNPNTGLSQAQLQSCLYSHHAHGCQPSNRNPHRNLPTAHQPSSCQQPSERESPPLPVVSPVTQLSNPCTICSRPSVPSSTTATSLHSQAASECSSAPSVAMHQQQATAEQKVSGSASRVPDTLSLQECLHSHGLQSALRMHSSLGAG